MSVTKGKAIGIVSIFVVAIVASVGIGTIITNNINSQGLGDRSNYPTPNESPVKLIGNAALDSYDYSGHPHPSFMDGSATYPYVFDSYIIDVETAPSSPYYGIWIASSSYYVVIQNCIIYTKELSGNDLGIVLDTMNYAVIKNCTIIGADYCVVLDSTIGCEVQDCNIIMNGTAIYGIYVENALGVTLAGNTIVEEYDNNPEFGIYVDGVLGPDVNNNTVDFLKTTDSYAILLDGFALGVVDDNIVSCGSGVIGILLYDFSLASADGNSLYGESASSGIYADDGEDATINDNTIEGFADGILCGWNYNLDDSEAIGNTISNTKDSGISWFASTNVIIDENDISDTDYGIYTVDLTEVNITRNNIVNAETGIYSDPSSNILIDLNIIEDAYVGIDIDTVSGAAVTNNTVNGCHICVNVFNSVLSAFTNNTLDGIFGVYAEQSGFIVLFQRNIIHARYGMFLYKCTLAVGAFENDITFSANGISLYQCDTIIILENTITWNGTVEDPQDIYDDFSSVFMFHPPVGYRPSGIMINDLNAAPLFVVNNTLHDASIAFQSPSLFGGYFGYDYMSDGNFTIIGNTVNGKPILVYSDQTALSQSVFDGFGQLILFNCDDIIIDSQTLDGGSVGITLQYCDNVTIDNVNMNGMSYRGITAYQTDNLVITGCTFTDTPDPLIIQYAENVEIAGCDITLDSYNVETFDELDYAQPIRGCYVHGIENLEFTGNTIRGGDFAVQIIAPFMGFNDEILIESNEIIDSLNGISVSISYNVEILSNTISGNIWYANLDAGNFGNFGIRVQNMENITVEDNEISDFIHGLLFDWAIINGEINDNTFTRSGISFRPDSFFTSSDWKSVIDNMYNMTMSGNMVNNRPIYYYIDQNDLDANDFVNAGQIILVNCNGSVIEDQEFVNVSTGIHLFHCFDSTIKMNLFIDNFYSLRMEGSYDNLIYLNHFERGIQGAITQTPIDTAVETDMNNMFYSIATKEGNWYWDYLIQNPWATNDGRVWNIPYQINGITTSPYIDVEDLYPLAYSPILEEAPALWYTTWWGILLIVLGSIAAGAGGFYGIQQLTKRNGSRIATGKVFDECADGLHLDGDGNCIP